MADLEHDLQKIWERILDVSPIDPTDNFFDLGGHSLLAVQLFLEIQKHTGHQLPLATLFRAPTIKRLAAVISQNHPLARWSPLVPIDLRGDREPLFIIHGLTGNVLNLRPLGLRIRSGRPVYAVQARGVDGAEPPLDRIEDMAEYYLDHIRGIQPRGPYLIVGYCFGGLVAFEIARHLSKSGENVAFLGLLDSFFYHRFLTPLRQLKYHLGKQMIHANIIRQLSPRGKLTYMRTKLGARLVQVTPAQRRRARLPYVDYLPEAEDIPAELRAVSAAAEQAFYRYEPRTFSGNVTYFRPAVRDFRNILDFTPEWSRKAVGGAEVVRVPGDHSMMLDAPAVSVLADRLRERVSCGSDGWRRS